MSKYSIKDLEVLSGIKAHTLRIWEQRYDLLKPQRTTTNIRYYSEDELKLLLNISLLNNAGVKISKIAQMTNDEIAQAVLEYTDQELSFPEQVNALSICMIDFDQDRLEKIISRCLLQHGFEKTVTHIIFPLLHRIGIMWHAGSVNPAQEHFLSHIIRKKLIVAIDAQDHKLRPDAKTFLLFLPEGELHEIGLLFAHYVISSRQHKVIYLGQSLPLDYVLAATETNTIDYIFTVVTAARPDAPIMQYLHNLKESFPHTPILMTGRMVVDLPSEVVPDGIRIMKTTDEVITFIETLSMPGRSMN